MATLLLPADAYHLLVVDDEPYTVQVLCDLLQFQGYRASGAYSGRRAQALLQASLTGDSPPIDLVVLDRSMPEPGGIEVCRWIKDHPRMSRVPVLMLTAVAAPTLAAEGLEAGADDYLAKPYHEQELLARIRALLRSSRMEQELFQRSQQLATLNQVVTAITAQIKLDDILDTTLRGIPDLHPGGTLLAGDPGAPRQRPLSPAPDQARGPAGPRGPGTDRRGPAEREMAAQQRCGQRPALSPGPGSAG